MLTWNGRYDCNGTAAQSWIVSGGKVQVAGTNFCLDAGSGTSPSSPCPFFSPITHNSLSADAAPANGIPLKIWTCYDNLPAQSWTYTSSSQLELATGDLCVDLTNGSVADGNVVQTWACVAGNANQVWTE